MAELSLVVDKRGAPAALVAKRAMSRPVRAIYIVLLGVAISAPVVGLYPVFVMKLLCFALFACAFNLLLGFTGLLSFGPSKPAASKCLK